MEEVVIGNSNTLVIEQPSLMRRQVYEHLRHQIQENIIEQGSRLVESQIAKTMGISRTPVREAFHLLEKDGVIESIPRVGYRVKILVMDELEEIFEIRKVNELLVCSWAIKKITPKDIRALEKNLKMTKRLLERNQPKNFLDLDQEFHEILDQASGSKHLSELCQQLRRLMARYRIGSIRCIKTVEGALKGHAAIVDALKRKDEKSLKTELLKHLTYSKQVIQEDC